MAVVGGIGRWIEALGGTVLGTVQFLGGLGLMVRQSVGHLVLGPFRGQGVPRRAFMTQAVRAGPKSLFIVCIINFFVGVILALIGGDILNLLGFKEYVGDLIGVGIVMELGPLLTGIIMTGYIGAAFAAEIGTMVVSEEIVALRTMALNPVRVIVAPRMLAVLFMVPCVTIIGNAVGILGGASVAHSVLDVSPNTFWEHVWATLAPRQVWRGLAKSVVFALLIGAIGCFKGFRVSGGAEGVGRATTSAVVTTIISIVISDGILNYLLLYRL